MKDNRTNYVIIGLFVLLMVGALVVSLAVILGRTGPTAAYYTVYDNVGGLKPGTQVMFEGYPVGQVARLEPVQENGRLRFRVHLDIVRDWPIPEDSVARIAASGLLAAVNIDIRGGQAAQVLPPGSRIPGRDGGTVFTVLDDVAGDVREITRETIRPLLDEIAGYITTVGQALETDAPQIMADVRTVVGEVAERTPRIADDLSAFTDKLNNRVMSEENLASIEGTIANVQATSDGFRAMTQELEAVSRQVGGLMTSVDGLMADSEEDVRTTLADLRYAMDVLSRHVDSIAHNLDGTSRNMLEFSRSLRQNPGLLLRGPAPRDEEWPR